MNNTQSILNSNENSTKEPTLNPTETRGLEKKKKKKIQDLNGNWIEIEVDDEVLQPEVKPELVQEQTATPDTPKVDSAEIIEVLDDLAKELESLQAVKADTNAAAIPVTENVEKEGDSVITTEAKDKLVMENVVGVEVGGEMGGEVEGEVAVEEGASSTAPEGSENRDEEEVLVEEEVEGEAAVEGEAGVGEEISPLVQKSIIPFDQNISPATTDIIEGEIMDDKVSSEMVPKPQQIEQGPTVRRLIGGGKDIIEVIPGQTDPPVTTKELVNVNPKPVEIKVPEAKPVVEIKQPNNLVPAQNKALEVPKVEIVPAAQPKALTSANTNIPQASSESIKVNLEGKPVDKNYPGLYRPEEPKRLEPKVEEIEKFKANYPENKVPLTNINNLIENKIEDKKSEDKKEVTPATLDTDFNNIFELIIFIAIILLIIFLSYLFRNEVLDILSNLFEQIGIL